MKKILLGFLLIALNIARAAEPRADYTAHEWGTFTSVQGGDGVLLRWRPLESSLLPGFVYDWKRPGLNRPVLGPNPFSKGSLVSLQRMETPVIYFYSKTEQTVYTSVKFPKGYITEWFPQAGRIGPAFIPDNPATVNESRIDWARVTLRPVAEKNNPPLPADKSGSHYFAARETDAAFVRVDAGGEAGPEIEKFLFYRGVGDFPTPLVVRMNDGGELTITNTGGGNLAHLFVLTLKQGHGTYFHFDSLAPGESRMAPVNVKSDDLSQNDLTALLGRDVANALVSQGLFQREAEAMVNTWRDSWFAEDGVRVLYLLPRAWTDETLPLTLNPAPESLVRVMVGRAEVITPGVQKELRDQLAAAAGGDAASRESAIAGLKKLGRFAAPALTLALKDADQKIISLSWQLLQQITPQPAAAGLQAAVPGPGNFE